MGLPVFFSFLILQDCGRLSHVYSYPLTFLLSLKAGSVNSSLVNFPPLAPTAVYPLAKNLTL